MTLRPLRDCWWTLADLQEVTAGHLTSTPAPVTQSPREAKASITPPPAPKHRPPGPDTTIPDRLF